MAIVENTAKKLVLQSGSTTLIARQRRRTDDAAKQSAVLEARSSSARRSRMSRDVKIEQNHDPASGADIYGTMVVMKSGGSVGGASRYQAASRG